MRAQLVKTYGKEVSEELKGDQLELTTAVACFDIAQNDGNQESENKRQFIDLVLSKDQDCINQLKPEIVKDIVKGIVSVQTSMISDDQQDASIARSNQLKMVKLIYEALKNDPSLQA